MNKLSTKDLLNLKQKAQSTQDINILLYIPALVEEILELRKELERYKFIAQTSHWE